MKQKVVVISGATSGIGKAVALGLARRGYQLVVIGRSQERGQELQRELQQDNPGCTFAYYLADMSDIAQVKKVSQEILAAYPVIDVLFNNAGAVFSRFELTPDGIERTMATNHIGYFVSTLILLPALAQAEDPRILLTSSTLHHNGKLFPETFHREKNYYIMRAYSQSKLANVLFGYALDRRLQGTSIKTNVLHPGAVKTPIGNKSQKAFHRFAWKLFTLFKGITPEASARPIIELADAPEGAQYRGKYFEVGKLQDSAPLSYDEKLQESLWKWSVEQTGVDFPAELSVAR